nr:hypothetical protein BaRGS_028402 [Batillaria attramentaria]
MAQHGKSKTSETSFDGKRSDFKMEDVDAPHKVKSGLWNCSVPHYASFKQHVHCNLEVESWVLGVTLAAVPLLPVTVHWEFYSQSGVPIPGEVNVVMAIFVLPVNSALNPFLYTFNLLMEKRREKHEKKLLVTLEAKMATDRVAAIFRSVKANFLTTDKNQKSKDIIIARRLISVAVSDFLCWFPIWLLGLLGSTGVPIPGEVNVVMTIFALPFNSALNPFL